MVYLTLLDKNLEAQGIITDFSSLIWDKKYNGVGECEVYAKVDLERFDIVKTSKFVKRSDDTMLCIIKKIEITTDSEKGDYVTITGQDCSCFMDQRIVWSPTVYNDTVENIIRNMITSSLIDLDIPNDIRNIYTDFYGQFFFLGDKVNFEEVAQTQISYKNVGEKIREFCSQYGWGYKVEIEKYPDSDNKLDLLFKLYKGDDLTNKVVFSEDNYNLITSKLTIDKSNCVNVARIGGEGEGFQRALVHVGETESFERNEIFVDSKNVQNPIKMSDIKSLYPGGSFQWLSNKMCYAYIVNVSATNPLQIPIIDETQATYLSISFGYGEIDDSGNYPVFKIPRSNNSSDPNHLYVAYIYNEQSVTPDDDSDGYLQDMFYKNLLFQPGVDAVAERPVIRAIEAVINPYGIFKYKEAWQLGDLIKIENKYGLSTQARIVEVIEVFNENGYSVEPKLEYITNESEE